MTAEDLAAYLVGEHPELADDPTKLNTLLYLVQGAHLAWFGTPAFLNRIEAWADGPTVMSCEGP